MSLAEERTFGMDPTYARKRWKWYVGVGALLVLLGIVAIVAAFAVTLATVLLFGVLLLIAGVVQVVDALSSGRSQGFGIRLFAGILYAAVGGLIVVDPVKGAVGITVLLAAFFLVGGALKLALGLQAEFGWFVASGVLSLLLGLLIVFGLPEIGGWVIGLFLGIEFLFAGVSLISLGLAARFSGTTQV